MQLRAPTKRPVVLAPVHPNQGLEAAYRKKLDALIDEMHASLDWSIKATYRANEPEMAQDDLGSSRKVGIGAIAGPSDLAGMSPAMALREAMRRLTKRWQRRFDNAAPDLAKYFALHATKRADGALQSILKRSGFAVEFKLTREANDVLQATISENVSLIKSIAEQHLTQVSGLVMRSVQQGRDLEFLSKELRERYGVTKRRAAFIALSQNNMATATITRVRQDSLGIVEADWLHSHGGKEPRPEHVAADGKRYNIKQGMFLDGKWTWPGVEPGCRCVGRSVIPGLED